MNIMLFPVVKVQNELECCSVLSINSPLPRPFPLPLFFPLLSKLFFLLLRTSPHKETIFWDNRDFLWPYRRRNLFLFLITTAGLRPTDITDQTSNLCFNEGGCGRTIKTVFSTNPFLSFFFCFLSFFLDSFLCLFFRFLDSLSDSPSDSEESSSELSESLELSLPLEMAFCLLFSSFFAVNSRGHLTSAKDTFKSFDPDDKTVQDLQSKAITSLKQLAKFL